MQNDQQFAETAYSMGLVDKERLKNFFQEKSQGNLDITIAQWLLKQEIIQSSQILEIQQKISEKEKETNSLLKTGIRPAADQKQERTQLLQGTKFGRYTIQVELGRGGMGRVYKAYDTQLDRIVALKMLLMGDINQNDIDRFLREAKATAKLHHPNIVMVHDIGTHENQPFFTLDLINGPSLDNLMKKSSFTTRNTVETMIKICNAIHYSHEQGVIHRDLKPANIMMENNKEPKIMDFGLAKMGGASKKLSKTGAVMGTLQYMPPEQAEGKSRAIDARSDVYSLGAILYEMITGRPPVTGGSSFQIINEIMNKEPIAPSKIKPRTSKVLEGITLKALAKKKEDRYQSAKELAEDLEKFIKGENVTIRSAKKYPLFLKKYAVVIFVTVVIVGNMLVHLSSSKPPKKNKVPSKKRILTEKDILIYTPELQKGPKIKMFSEILDVKGSVSKKIKVAYVFIDGQKIKWDKQQRSFSYEKEIQNGTNHLEILLLTSEKRWIRRQWEITSKKEIIASLAFGKNHEPITKGMRVDPHEVYFGQAAKRRRRVKAYTFYANGSSRVTFRFHLKEKNKIYVRINHSIYPSKGRRIAPINIYVNGKTFKSNYPPKRGRKRKNGKKGELFNINSFVKKGENTLQIMLGAGAVCQYAIRDLEIEAYD